jgi:hypothetical protein
MATFHEGQAVEVHPFESMRWLTAIYIARASDHPITRIRNYQVQMPNGISAIFDAEHIRAIDPDYEHAPESKPGGGFL